MADNDGKTESPLDKFKSTMKGLLNEVLDERDAKKPAGDGKSVTADGDNDAADGKKSDGGWLGSFFGG